MPAREGRTLDTAGRRRRHLALGSLSVLALAGPGRSEEPEPGIARSLALERAESLEGVSYDLSFRIEPDADLVWGEVALHFRRTRDGSDLVVDFAGDQIEELRLDGQPLPEARVVHNHLVIPAARAPVGRHVLQARFASRVASTGTPLTVYRDATHETAYYYTLLVPADAHRLFPCFDQPDLKAVYRLALDLPADWTGVANGDARLVQPSDAGRRLHRFAPSFPISTYLFAFAAGPFAVYEGDAPGADSHLARPLRLLYRPERAEHVDLAALEALHSRSLSWLEAYFAVPYPFGKLDGVLVPGFPYGGMEHPGAIFYRETALSFDHPPSEEELTRRSTLIYHEVSHQWFGNLVTMKWFDDLWLKEGFATFVGYSALEELEPDRNAWLRFHQRVKPSAYRVDVTTGTTPVFQRLGNLADAKSNYGAIVYNKAPAILRELEARLGRPAFRAGVTLFLTRFARSNATWRELIGCLEESSGADLQRWADRWINAPGLPTVRAEWTEDAAGTVTRFELVQRGRQEGETWPVNVRMLVASDGGARQERVLGLLGARTRLEAMEGRPSPRWVLLNPKDVEYGQFLLDPKSTEALLEDLPAEPDPLLRSTAFAALWETVRECELDPRRFLDTATRMLADERDPLTHGRFLGAIQTALERYLPAGEARERRASLCELLQRQLRGGLVPGQQIGLFRAVCDMADVDAVPAWICRVLDGDVEVDGLTLGSEDRFRAVGGLIAVGAEGAEERLSDLESNAEGDVSRSVYVARAARPTAGCKAETYASYFDPEDPPEQWVQQSLATFHGHGQEELTLPYLRLALERAEWVKEHRKIFFMPAWLNTFVNAHSSPEALETVRTFLDEHEDLPADIRRKLLQSMDGLERAVRIRERWSSDGG